MWSAPIISPHNPTQIGSLYGLKKEHACSECAPCPLLPHPEVTSSPLVCCTQLGSAGSYQCRQGYCLFIQSATLFLVSCSYFIYNKWLITAAIRRHCSFVFVPLKETCKMGTNKLFLGWADVISFSKICCSGFLNVLQKSNSSSQCSLPGTILCGIINLLHVKHSILRTMKTGGVWRCPAHAYGY